MTRLAILAVVIFVAVGAATVRYLDRALRRQPIPPSVTFHTFYDPTLTVAFRDLERVDSV